METNNRPFEIESEFEYSFGIVSGVSDILCMYSSSRFEELDKRSVDQLTFALHQEAQKLYELFQEMNCAYREAWIKDRKSE